MTWLTETMWWLLHLILRTLPTCITSLRSSCRIKESSVLVPCLKYVLSIMHCGQRNNTFSLLSSRINPGHSSQMSLSISLRADWRSWYPPGSCEVSSSCCNGTLQVTKQSMKVLSGDSTIKSSHWCEGIETLANWFEMLKSVVVHALIKSAWTLQKSPDGKMQYLLGVKYRMPMTPISLLGTCSNCCRPKIVTSFWH